jgi:hypothetical protein
LPEREVSSHTHFPQSGPQARQKNYEWISESIGLTVLVQHIAESSSPMSYATNALLFDLDDTLFVRDRAFRNWAESFVRTQLEAQPANIIIGSLGELFIILSLATN